MGNKVITMSDQLPVSHLELELLTEQFQVLSKKSKAEGQAISLPVWLKYFLPESPSLSQRLFTAFDMDKDGKVGFCDFFEGMVKCLKSSDDERLRFVFKMFSATESTGKVKGDHLKAAFPEHIRRRELAQALYPFQGQDSKELSFQAGDKLVILNKKHEVWWWAQHTENHQQKGYIPKDYISIMPPERVGIEKYYDQNGFVQEAQFMVWAPTCTSLQNFLNIIRYFELRPPPEFEITGPTGFTHTTHIGYNPVTGGFETGSMPPEWQLLLHKAGISAEEAADPSTAKFITQVLSKTMEKAADGVLAEILALSPSPAPQPTQTITVQPQPIQQVQPDQPLPELAHPAVVAAELVVIAPGPFVVTPEPVIETHPAASEPVVVQPVVVSTPPSNSTSLPVAAVQPTQQEPGVPKPVRTGGPPPPPPPMPPQGIKPAPRNATGPNGEVSTAPQVKQTPRPNVGGVFDLLEDIKRGKALRKVDPSEIDLKQINVNPDDLASVLRRAMEQRRFDLEEDHTVWDEEDEDWSD